LDEITKEKQRISEALARVDMQRQKLASQLGELEATERVLARYSDILYLRGRVLVDPDRSIFSAFITTMHTVQQ
jgi:hypothetical protein